MLGIPAERIVDISGGADGQFKKMDLSESQKAAFFKKYQITKPFVFYLGNDDFRKNMFGALEGFANLPEELRKTHQFVVNRVNNEKIFFEKVKLFGLNPEDVIITGQISDAELILFYNLCTVSFSPPFMKVLAYPVLEAMKCGAPVIAANNSSLPEVVNRTDMLLMPRIAAA